MNLCSRSKEFIGLLFPGTPVYEDIPLFCSEGSKILFSERPGPVEENVLWIRKGDFRDCVRIDTRDGFLRVLKSRGVKLSHEDEKKLNCLCSEDFWRVVKCMLVTEVPKSRIELSRQFRVEDLIKVLFHGLSKSFPVYADSGVPHRTLFFKILAFMTDDDKKLECKTLNMGIYKSSVISYLKSKKEEHDFLTFLHDCFPEG